MTNNTNPPELPAAVQKQIDQEAEQYASLQHTDKGKHFGHYQSQRWDDAKEDWEAGATSYATKLLTAEEKIKVLEYDNTRLKGELEGYKAACEELKEKYDNILATESGHESKTENVWQSGYASGHEAGCEKALKAQQGGWVKADQKPEHNVGVLVFIPGEDNHITSGMWDISNEWVLLDEYRTPEEKVTHWMLLPAFPEGYAHDMLSDEWVSTLKAIAKEELSKRPKGNITQSRADLIGESNNRDLDGVGNKEREIAFAEWVCSHGYWPIGKGQWNHAVNKTKTTSKLWNEWQHSNQQKRNSSSP